MSLHISSFLKHIQLGRDPEHPLSESIRNMALDYPTEFGTAKEIKNVIGSNCQMETPESEGCYLAVLLISLRGNPGAGRISIVVVMHGNSTANDMVRVISQLLSVDNLGAAGMPLGMPPKEVLRKIVKAVGEVNGGNGILLLMDIGSLSTLSEEIARQTGIDVRIVDMVTIPIVLEMACKITLIGTQLETLYGSLRNFHDCADIRQSGNEANH